MNYNKTAINILLIILAIASLFLIYSSVKKNEVVDTKGQSDLEVLLTELRDYQSASFEHDTVSYYPHEDTTFQWKLTVHAVDSLTYIGRDLTKEKLVRKARLFFIANGYNLNDDFKKSDLKCHECKYKKGDVIRFNSKWSGKDKTLRVGGVNPFFSHYNCGYYDSEEMGVCYSEDLSKKINKK